MRENVSLAYRRLLDTLPPHEELRVNIKLRSLGNLLQMDCCVLDAMRCPRTSDYVKYEVSAVLTKRQIDILRGKPLDGVISYQEENEHAEN